MIAINLRRSVREYSEVEVEEEKIRLILKAAMQAPSARNQQGTRYLVVKDKEKLLKISEQFQTMRFAKDASFAIIFLIDLRDLKVLAMAPADAAASLENSLIEASSLGVGSCWCGVYPNEERIVDLKKMFKINDFFVPFGLVTYGYPKEEPKFINRFDENKIFYEEVK